MRKYTIPQSMSVEYFLGDHLGSTSITTDANGVKVSEMRYKPWGETRYASGNTSTRYQYTGQLSYESDFGLYFYQSRFYDSSIGRFSSPDTIIPQGQGVQAWDRYAFVNNNPLRYTDPSGHALDDGCRDYGCDFGTSSSTLSSSSYTPSPAGGSNDHENCNGLECIYNDHDDDETTLPTGMPSEMPPLPDGTPSFGDSPNPSVGALVVIGVLLTGAIVVSEIGLVWAEIYFAPVVAVNPLVGIPLEAVLVSTSLALIDIDVAYWSDTYRVQKNPDVKQDFEILPPWGL